MDEVMAQFLQSGLLGAAIVGLTVALWRVYRSQQATQEKRVAESQSVTNKLVGIAEKWTATIEAQTAMIEKHNENVISLRNECRERTEGVRVLIVEMIRELRDYVHATRKGGHG